MADPKTTNHYKGIYYFTKDDALQEAEGIGGSIVKTARGFQVKDSLGNFLGPEALDVSALSSKLIDFKFDDTAEKAANVAAKFAAQMVTEISKQTATAIRGVIADSIREGIPPYDAARMIVPMIGLTSAQAQAVKKYRAELIDNGLTLEKVNEKVDDYGDELLAKRGEAIARTEILDALNDAQDLAWVQAQDAGFLTANAMKEVILSEDACPICVAIADNGPVPVGDDFSEDGPPFHPHCRCTVGISTP